MQHKLISLMTIQKRFQGWDGIIASNQQGVFLLKTNPTKFFPENPLDFVESIRHFLLTEKVRPVRMDIDITNICNNECTFCFNVDFRKSNSVGVSQEKILSIFDDLKGMGLKSVRFTGGGDALTYPGFTKVLKEAHSRGFLITLETNGDGLNSSNIYDIVKYVTHLRVSVDSANNETRKIIHRPKNPSYTLDRLIDSLTEIHRLRHELGRESQLMIGATFLLLPENYLQVNAFIRLATMCNIDWVAVRKTTDSKIYTQHPHILAEGLTQLSESIHSNTTALQIIGPYGVSHKPSNDFDHCMMAITRLIVLANSTAHLCCLARNQINIEGTKLGEIKNSTHPIHTLYQAQQSKVNFILNEAPNKCRICIDADMNLFLSHIRAILADDNKTVFRKLKLNIHNKDYIEIVNKTDSDVVVCNIPPFIHDELILKQVVGPICRNTISSKTNWLIELKQRYESRLVDIQQQFIEKGFESVRSLYSELDRSLLLHLKDGFLLSTTHVLLSGSINRNNSNRYSDFDLILIESGEEDVGIQEFLKQLKLISDKEVQSYHGTVANMKQVFLSNPWERMIMLDSSILDNQGITLRNILGFSAEEFRKMELETIFFKTMRLIQSTEIGLPLNIKFTPGLFKSMTIYPTIYLSLNIDIKPRERRFLEQHQKFIGQVREELQNYYGKEENQILFEFNQYFLGKYNTNAEQKLYSNARKAQSIFLKYLPSVFEKLNEAHYYGNFMGVIQSIKDSRPIYIKPNSPYVATLVAVFSKHPRQLKSVYLDYHKIWMFEYYLSVNPHCPQNILEELSKRTGYLNRDIRLQVARNPSVSDSILASMIDDPHPAVRATVLTRLESISTEPSYAK